jgi:hypothetical protein
LISLPFWNPDRSTRWWHQITYRYIYLQLSPLDSWLVCTVWLRNAVPQINSVPGRLSFLLDPGNQSVEERNSDEMVRQRFQYLFRPKNVVFGFACKIKLSVGWGWSEKKSEFQNILTNDCKNSANLAVFL